MYFEVVICYYIFLFYLNFNYLYLSEQVDINFISLQKFRFRDINYYVYGIVIRICFIFKFYDLKFSFFFIIFGMTLCVKDLGKYLKYLLFLF